MKVLLALLIVCFSGFAQAQTPPVAVATATAIATRSGWNGIAVAADDREDRDFLKAVLLQQFREPIVNSQLLRKENDYSWNSAVTVYNVGVETLSNGSIRFSNWRDLGSSTWATDYTVSRRDDQFVVSGLEYQYQFQDASGSCSINFLNGEALVNGRRKTVPAQRIDFATATDAALLAQCHALLGIP